MSDALRLFIGLDVAIECSNQLRETAASLSEQLPGDSATWVAPARYHVTLKYLGWTQPEAVFAIRARLAPVFSNQRELRFEIGDLGAFPSADKARVLWAAAIGPELAALATTIDHELEELGFERETREFRPHVTLARLREVADLRETIVGSERKYSVSRCRFVNLYESAMNSDVSEYPVKHRWELKSPKRQRSDLEQRDN